MEITFHPVHLIWIVPICGYLCVFLIWLYFFFFGKGGWGP